ncbi:MAG: hypothetical protein KY459_02690 [Acidobacteria bacterium]|nr:hypothetical protein [Acidobacteriota bacterium]
MRFLSIRKLSLSVLALLLPLTMVYGATPESGDLSSSTDEVTWSGEFFVSNPTLCTGEDDPVCDHFRLTISSPSIQRVLIAIAPQEGYEEDDYDLFVYDDQGVLLNSEASSDGFESVVIENTGSSYYEVRIQPWFVTSGSRYSGVAMKTREQMIDVENNDCLELVPDTLSVVDTGQVVELSVMLLLDGTDSAVAEEIMARAADSYAPLGINLVLKRTRKVSYTSTVSSDLISDAKATVGGVPPNGIDLVGVFTTKTMQSTAGGATVVGQADCIGGIRWDENSFFVLSDIRHIEDPESGTTGTLNSMGFNPNVDATAEVMAHEIGHLMGAHHHYANCVEGSLSSTGPSDLSPCTLMFNAVNFASINFTTLSGSVVRGHAIEYAAP